jgi:GT2 family glycosyltransferase
MQPEAQRDGEGRATAVTRPAVSIVLPFHGTAAEADAAVEALLAIDLLADDEIVVADNSGSGSVRERPRITVARADAERSSYYARNVGAAIARNDWLLLVDGDCRPRPDILDRYLAELPADDVGAVVGEVVGDPDQDALVARYARSRGHLGQLTHWTSPFRPWGITANLLVRRAAWESVGGFQEGIRSTGDAEFSWRLQDAGWRLAYRPDAVVEHSHRESVRKLARQAARYGAGQAWVRRRYPGSGSRPRLAREIGRSVAGVLVWTATGRLERATFKALDAVYVTSEWAASRLSNVPQPRRLPARDAAVGVAGDFPALDKPQAAELARRAQLAAVEAVRRPIRVDREAARALHVAWAQDDGTFRRLSATAWVAARHPWRALRHVARGRHPKLRDVATRARRIAAMQPAALVTLGDGSDADTQALAALLALEVKPAAGGGARPQSTSVR